ncbi:leucyl aminopeptidase [Idiomarina sp. A28L]|uniref:M17 family metallopeptidase n=1 Tax=Idiomarina sp. A28L TaxID=1036674 RepID=UPI0002138E5F|nr:leucyl aminopeptidase family protein [Idiomarina sp. A28L]EGN76294.1 leucyl aminopeptidase [Idiomarina sp. A28L]
MATPKLTIVSSIQELPSSGCDALVVLSHDLTAIPAPFAEAVQNAQQLDAQIINKTSVLRCEAAPAQRLIVAATGPLNRDYDDVRRFFDAARNAAIVVRDSGAIAPVLWLPEIPNTANYENAVEAAWFGFCQGLYEPLEAREHFGESVEPVSAVTLIAEHSQSANSVQSADWLYAVEEGRRVARDLCGTEPERMAPMKFAEYCQQAFAGTSVKVQIIDDKPELEHEYPLLSAVGRASFGTSQRPCVIRLEYTPEGSVDETLMIVGKGITYDTGGADVKTGGHMAGMSRDKGGAAGVAGFVKAVAGVKPQGLKVIAELAAVRNNIDALAFVADEIITGRSGKRVRIGNTDAEGRLVMADCLAHLTELAKNEVNPSLYTVATLTGHAALAKGPYSAFVPNGPAVKTGLVNDLLSASEAWADPAELSPSRREDYDFVRGRTKADDLLSSNNGPSATTKRGHQFPMAFLTEVALLNEHGNNSEKPLPYIHIDIAGSGVEGGDWQHGKPTATPVLAFAGKFLIR